MAFGAIVLALPALNVFETAQSRNAAFYIMTVLFGSAFGVAFSTFHDLVWHSMPADVNIANAMGFNLMSRLLGVGLGNFFAGMILDMFWMDDGSGSMYAPGGYVLMCSCSGLAVLCSAVLCESAIQMSVDSLRPRAEDEGPAAPAA